MAPLHNILLSTLLVVLCMCCFLSATPTPPTPTESPTPLTSHDRLNEVIRGTSVLRRHTSNQFQLGSLYNVSNGTTVRGFYAFSVLLQSFQTISILESNNYTSTDLTIFKVILDGVLDDTCQWFKSYNISIDCTDRTRFISILLAMGLQPHLTNLDCFLRGLGTFTGDQSLQGWIRRTFTPSTFLEQDLTCQVCTSLNLQNCCPSQ